MQKTAIVTGGNAGLGFETAKRLISAGFKVLIACRNLEKGTHAQKLLQEISPTSEILLTQLNLEDLGSIEKFASEISFKWDLLINNAGAKIERPMKLTKQGFEWHVGVNHLGHFALTGLLLKKAKAGASVVTVSSIVARKGNLDFEMQNPFNERQAYANSKLMNVIFAQALSKRFEQTDLKSIAAHPGFARANPYGNKFVRTAEYAFAQSAKLGAGSIWEATKAENGEYIGPRFFELWGAADKARIPEVEYSAIENFWKRSEELTGVSFSLM